FLIPWRVPLAEPRQKLRQSTSATGVRSEQIGKSSWVQFGLARTTLDRARTSSDPREKNPHDLSQSPVQCCRAVTSDLRTEPPLGVVTTLKIPRFIPHTKPTPPD